MPDEPIGPTRPERGHDGGPIYTETPPEVWRGEPIPGTVAEPWNTATAFLFVVIVIAWVIRLRGRIIHYPFMACALPILFVGGVGGTLYHGLRNRFEYFLADVIPIQLLGLAVSIYLWLRLGRQVRYLFGLVAVIAMMQLLGQVRMPSHIAITISYGLLGILILVPLTAALVRTRFRAGGWIATALVSFGLALFFRYADRLQPSLLPMGTHWLWHTFGAITTAALAEWVYRLHDVDFSIRKGQGPEEVAGPV